MYRNILLCYDGTVEGREALKEGAEVALAMNAHTHLLAILRSSGADLATTSSGPSRRSRSGSCSATRCS